MSKRCKKLEEIKNMFKDIDINFDDINDNGIEEFINIIKLTKDDRYQYFNSEDYVNVVFKLGDKLEIDYDNSKVKISFVEFDNKDMIIDELIKNIYVNRDEVASTYEFGKKEVNNNIKKMLPNG